MEDLVQDVGLGHLELVVVGRSATLDGPKASRRVNVNRGLLESQLETPNSDHREASKESEIGFV